LYIAYSVSQDTGHLLAVSVTVFCGKARVKGLEGNETYSPACYC